MLKLKNSSIQIEPWSVNQKGGDCNYYRDTLLPLMREGKWDEIQEYAVIQLPDGGSIKFGSNKWDLRLLDAENPTTLLFTHKGKVLPSRLRNETKAAILARMLTGQKTVTLSSLLSWLNKLKPIVLELPKIGLESFSQLTDEKMKDIAELNSDIFNNAAKVSAINTLIDYYEELPFDVNFSAQSSEKLGIQYKKQEQHLAIPPRIYAALLTHFSKEVNDLMPHLEQIENEITRLLSIKAKFKSYLFEQFRCGDILNPFNRKEDLDRVKAKFEKEGVPLIDNLKGEQHSPGRWIQIVNELRPNLKGFTNYAKTEPWAYEPFQVGERQFNSISDFKNFLVDCDFKCKTLCLLLSGMRVDELNSMHPMYGAQSYIYDRQTIRLFTTRQSKITKGMQTEEDIFVTNQTGHNAFRLLTTIHRPYLNMICDDDKVSFFASITFDYYPKTIIKKDWACYLMKLVNQWIEKNVGSSISAEDESFLRISNPSNTGIEAGATYKFTNHQTRRSLAFYMIGLELMAYPQLKKQLSHLSSAMTRHYANNASYWGSLRTEIHQERVLQKSNLLANVYKRLAQGGKIAGGKGKAMKKLAGNENYFESGVADRRLDPSYWAKLIEGGKEHIHAIAPGMYCTNAQCDMRINVALDECVDCEFDYIMDGLYAEGKRLAAHRNLAILDEMNDLNHNVASQLVVEIKSCEKILSDLEIPFTPIEIPENINKMLISTVAV
jgi:integrase